MRQCDTCGTQWHESEGGCEPCAEVLAMLEDNAKDNIEDALKNLDAADYKSAITKLEVAIDSLNQAKKVMWA